MVTGRKALVVVLVAVLALGGMPLASTAGPVDRTDLRSHLDAVRVGMRPTPGERLEFMASLVGARSGETMELGEQASERVRERVLERVRLLMALVEGEIERGLQRGEDLTGAVLALEKATRQARETLTSLLEEVPEEAREALEGSLRAMEAGRQAAIEVLERIGAGEVPGRPEAARGALDEIQPPDKGRADEAGRPEEVPAKRPGGN